jgi:streptogramin lyase
MLNGNTSQSRITTGPDGNLWFVEYDGNALGRITPQGAITNFPLPASHSGPDSITKGPDGALWFTESDGNTIGRYSP